MSAIPGIAVMVRSSFPSLFSPMMSILQPCARDENDAKDEVSASRFRMVVISRTINGHRVLVYLIKEGGFGAGQGQEGRSGGCRKFKDLTTS